MTPEIKRLFDRFCIAVTVVVVIAMILCGKVAAEEHGEKILQGTEYKSVMLESTDNKLTLQVDEAEIMFNKTALEQLFNVNRLSYLAPFYFFQCVSDLIRQ